MRDLIDMNLSPRWVGVLQAAGIDACHWSTLGPATATDFGAILAASGERGPSVVQVRAGHVDPSAIGTQLVQALRQLATELADGALLTVEPESTRVRLLPLPRTLG